MDRWIYENSEDNRERYLLGYEGRDPLMCFGINPSTAEPGDLDNTMRRVKGFAEEKGFDGYLMVNLYPQRSTDPDGLDQDLDSESHRRNLSIIDQTIERYEVDRVWAAWGSIIDKRKSYLYKALEDINKIVTAHGCHWITIGDLTKAGHPRHPLYLPYRAGLDDFNIDRYLEENKKNL